MSSAPESIKRITGVWLTLLLLLAFTLISAYVPLGKLNTVINIVVAAAKAAIVILFFMHVRDARPAIRLIAAAGFIWLGILISYGITETLTR